MRPLKVLVIVKNTPRAFDREKRNMGQWSYEVPEFEWDFVTLGKSFKLDTRKLKAQGYDFAYHEDGGCWGDYIGNALPVIYHSIDSTLTHDNHYLPRLQQAAKSSLILLEHDDPERFASAGQRVRSFPYCVNDLVFYEQGMARDIDVNFHCGGRDEQRAQVRNELASICAKNGLNFVSGVVELETYAKDLSRAKIVVNVPRTPINRPHRVFDALACGACLLTMPLARPPKYVVRGGDYEVFDTIEMLEKKIKYLLVSGDWEILGQNGLETVHANHSWRVRAGELRAIVHEEFRI